GAACAGGGPVVGRVRVHGGVVRLPKCGGHGWVGAFGRFVEAVGEVAGGRGVEAVGDEGRPQAFVGLQGGAYGREHGVGQGRFGQDGHRRRLDAVLVVRLRGRGRRGCLRRGRRSFAPQRREPDAQRLPKREGQ